LIAVSVGQARQPTIAILDASRLAGSYDYWKMREGKCWTHSTPVRLTVSRIVSNSDGPCVPIWGFQSYRHFECFAKKLESLVEQGRAGEVTPDPNYHYGMIYGGRWFKDRQSGALWSLFGV
jgi:hypothetical protein